MISYEMREKVKERVPTAQLNLRPLEKTIGRLAKLAERHKGHRARKNEVAVEIIEQYMPLWEAAQRHQELVRAQQKMELEESGQVFTGAGDSK